MNLSNDQFKNQPRLGAAIRQRSHSTKELTTMLHQLQLSVQLMPLDNNNLKIKNLSNLVSTSEEESDSMNSVETTTSEDETFGDLEDEFNNNLKTEPIQLKENLKIENLTTTKKLRRSNSLGSLLNLKKLNKDNELFCDELDSMDDLRKNKLNNRNSKFRSTLPFRYSISLKDLNNLNNLNNKSNQLTRLVNYFKNDKKKLKSNDLNKENKLMKKEMKSIEIDNLINGDEKLNSLNLKNNLFNNQANIENQLITRCGEYKLSKYSEIEENKKLTNVCLTTANDFNNQIQLDDNLEVCLNSSSEFINCNHQMVNGAATSGEQNKITLEDINKVVNYKSSVSSCICNSSAEYSSQKNLKLIKNENENENLFINKNLVKEQTNYQFNDFNKNLNYRTLLSSNYESTVTTSDHKTSFDYLQIQNKINKDHHHYLNSESIKDQYLFKEIQDSQYKSNCNDKNSNHLKSELQRDDEQKFLNSINFKNQTEGLKNCDQLNENDNLKDLLLNFDKSILNKKIYSTINKISFQSELPIVFEENSSKLNLNNNNYKNSNLDLKSKMQTLAETQYNQLSYHLAALSCVCDNNTKNINSNYSSFNQPSSSVDSSPNSSQYSSPYNLSPPSSPSSVSSYSSAEEDCSILTSVKNDHHKINTKFNNQNSLADLLTVDSKLNNNSDNSVSNDLTKQPAQESLNENLDVVDCAAFKQDGLLTTALVNKLNKNNLNDNDLNNNNKIEEMKQKLIEDGSQLDNELKFNKKQINQNNQNDKDQQPQQKPVRVRKTSILRNQTPDLSNCTNYCKKEVKFADTLGFQLEKIKYFPPQVKPKRHSVNLASLARDYYDEHQELFILHSRPQNKDNVAKQFEERSTLFSKQQARLGLNTNIFSNQQQQRSFSPPHQSSNNFWANYTNYHQFSPIRDQYCGDMFYQTFEQKHNLTNLTTTNVQSTIQINSQLESNSFVNTQLNQQPQSIYPPVNYKSNSLEFNGLNFMNSQINQFNSMNQVSFLPLNFGQPYIQSDFPNRLRSQSVLLHSLDVIGNTIHGIISVINLTFEKKIIVKYTLNKWVTESNCEARYSKKDFDNSDKFIFQITLKEQDFPQFQLDDDRTMMFAICYETGDGQIFWDNNHGQDFRLKCKFN